MHSVLLNSLLLSQLSFADPSLLWPCQCIVVQTQAYMDGGCFFHRYLQHRQATYTMLTEEPPKLSSLQGILPGWQGHDMGDNSYAPASCNQFTLAKVGITKLH